MKETFNCVTLSRADFESRGFDTTNIDDTTMANIAMKIGDSLVENLYWELIEFHGTEHSMPPTPAAAFWEGIAPIIEEQGGYLNLHSDGNAPILDEETMTLEVGGVTRFVGTDNEEFHAYNDMPKCELEFIRDLLVVKGYLKDETPTEEPEEEPEEGQFPLTICDTGNGEEDFTTFENEGEMIAYFNDNFAAARGKEFETIADCMVWIAESSYLSVALWKEYEVTLSYHQSVIVKTHGFSKNDAIKSAYAADFDNPEECTQLGWQEDGDPSAEEI